MFAAFQDLNIEGILPGDDDATTASSWLLQVFIIFMLSESVPMDFVLLPRILHRVCFILSRRHGFAGSFLCRLKTASVRKYKRDWIKNTSRLTVKTTTKNNTVPVPDDRAGIQ
jgi:hypothetical protein